MKTLKYLSIAALAVAAASCNSNELPEFTDGDAFVSFASATASVDEQKTIDIVIGCASTSGITTTATIAVEAAEGSKVDAVEGVDFEIVGSKTLQFDAQNRTASLKVKALYDGKFTGDKNFKLVIAESGSNVGYERTCLVTIGDIDHPLSPILGTYAASAVTYYQGPMAWDITIEKDKDDLQKVWIKGFEPYLSANGYLGNIFGVVNDDMTEIAIPSGQAWGYRETALVGITHPDPDDADAMIMKDGDNIIIKVNDGGANLTIVQSYGIRETATSGGWYNIVYGDLTITKK